MAVCLVPSPRYQEEGWTSPWGIREVELQVTGRNWAWRKVKAGVMEASTGVQGGGAPSLNIGLISQLGDYGEGDLAVQIKIWK